MGEVAKVVLQITEGNGRMDDSERKSKFLIFSIFCILFAVLSVIQTIWDIFFVGGFIQGILSVFLLLISISMVPIAIIYGLSRSSLGRIASVTSIGAIVFAFAFVWSMHLLDSYFHLKFRLRYHAYQEVVEKIQSGELPLEFDAPLEFQVALPTKYSFLTTWDTVRVIKEMDDLNRERAYHFEEIESLDWYSAFVYQPEGTLNEGLCWLSEEIGPNYPGWYFCDNPG